MFGVLLAGAYTFGNGTFLESPAPHIAANNVAEVETEGSGVVSVTDQPSGDTVTVESVTVPPPGAWVAVREVSSGGDLRNILGAVRVNGPRSLIPVALLRATEPDRPYAVELYRDDGDGTFDPSADSVYVDFDSGAPAVARFSTTR